MSGKGYLLLLGLLVVGLFLAEAARPRPLDTRVKLERRGAAPFDAEVLYASLAGWLGQPVEPVDAPPFDRLADTTVTGRTYLFLTERFEPDADEAERLLAFAARGNTVVVAARELGGAFGDSLGRPDAGGVPGLRSEITVSDLGLDDPFSFDDEFAADDGFAPDTMRLLPPGVSGDYPFPVTVGGWHLEGLDPGRTVVLGTNGTEPTLARVRVGEGAVVVSTTPLAFSNAALTGDGAGPAYVAGVLAALPDQPVWWDGYYKPFKAQSRTPLRFVLATPALRWAYVLLVVAGLLYLAFRARRWQRAIPVVAPPPNAQREFARTVGRLHYVHRDDARLAQRQAAHVLDRLRTDLRIADPDLSPETADVAAARAGVPADEARALFATLARVSRERAPDADTLVRLDARTARFFRHVDADAPANAPAEPRSAPVP